MLKHEPGRYYWDVWQAGPVDAGGQAGGWCGLAHDYDGQVLAEVAGHETRHQAETELRRLLTAQGRLAETAAKAA